MLYGIIISCILFILLLMYITRLIYINKRLQSKEEFIINLFNKRTSMIPALYDVTKRYFIKHKDIFKNILKYRNKELYKYYIQEGDYNLNNEFLKMLIIEGYIHSELNFIFRVANKHQKLIKQGNFIYLRELIINISYEIGKNLEDYRTKVKLYNKLVFFNKFKKDEI